MWSDNETSEDLLGFKVHADLIIDVIKDDNILPVTVGIFGDWGSGKSSVLKIIKEDLEKLDDGTFVLYFNGWVFEGYDDAKAALLESIIKAFDENKKLSAKVKDKTSKLLKSVKWMRLLGLGFKNIVLPGAAAYLSGGATLIPFLAGELTKQTSNPEELIKKLKEGTSEDFLKSLVKDQPEVDETMLVREFRNDFSEMISKSEIKKLVVIIDDLDRCTPDRIIENLEAIKLFLNVEKTAFLIGADPRIVRHAIEYRFKPKVDDANDRIVDDYLEKLIQIPYYLPKLSDSEVETYISLLVCKRELKPESFNSVIEKFGKYRENDRYSVYGLSNIKETTIEQEHSVLTKSISAIAPLVSLIASSLYGNPRQIKRFLNTFTLRKRLADVAKIKNFNDAVLAKLMILEYSELSLFRQIYEWQLIHDGVPDQIKILEDLIKDKPWEEAKTEVEKSDQKLWAKEKIVKWLNSDPKLQGVDLRDYYWISRDKISSSIPGASLIPPFVRATFNQLEEELPATASKKIIQDKVKTLRDEERFIFLEFSAKMLKKNPRKKRYFDIFNYMLDENITDAPTYYLDALKNVSVNDLEAAVGTTLRSYKAHPILGEFLKKYFEKNVAPAAKAFNLN